MTVIFIAAFADVPMAVRALKFGAVEFVEKPFIRQSLLEKVQRAIKDDVDRRCRLADCEALRTRFLRLTDKEREVLGTIKDSWPNKTMATAFNISAHAVEMRRASLMKKLEVHSVAELMRLTIEHEVGSEFRHEGF